MERVQRHWKTSQMSNLVFTPDDAEIERRVEALLFAAAAPLSAAEIARRLPEGADTGRAIASLRQRYQGRGGRAGMRGRPLALSHRP